MLDPQTIELLTQFGINPAAVESLIVVGAVLSVLAVVAAIPTVVISKRKRRSPTLWLLFALSIPLLPLLLVWWLPALSPDPKARP